MIFAFNHIIIIRRIHLAIIIFNKIIHFMSSCLTLFQSFYGFFLNIKFIFFFMYIYTHTCSMIFTSNYIIIIHLDFFMSLYLKLCNARDLDFFKNRYYFFLFLPFSPIISKLISLNLITIQNLHLIFLLLNK